MFALKLKHGIGANKWRIPINTFEMSNGAISSIKRDIKLWSDEANYIDLKVGFRLQPSCIAAIVCLLVSWAQSAARGDIRAAVQQSTQYLDVVVRSIACEEKSRLKAQRWTLHCAKKNKAVNFTKKEGFEKYSQLRSCECKPRKAWVARRCMFGYSLPVARISIERILILSPGRATLKGKIENGAIQSDR